MISNSIQFKLFLSISFVTIYNTCIKWIINICYHIKVIVLNCIGWPHIILNTFLFKQTTKSLLHKCKQQQSQSFSLLQRIIKLQKNLNILMQQKRRPTYLNLSTFSKNQNDHPCPPFIMFCVIVDDDMFSIFILSWSFM